MPFKLVHNINANSPIVVTSEKSRGPVRPVQLANAQSPILVARGAEKLFNHEEDMKALPGIVPVKSGNETWARPVSGAVFLPAIPDTCSGETSPMITSVVTPAA
jgi:hypothetical protein